jgi:hypothetical protein
MISRTNRRELLSGNKRRVPLLTVAVRNVGVRVNEMIADEMMRFVELHAHDLEATVYEEDIARYSAAEIACQEDGGVGYFRGLCAVA